MSKAVERTKKRKTKDLPDGLSKLTGVNFRTSLKSRFETDPSEAGEVMVAYEVSLEEDDETFALDKLTLDQLRMLCKNVGVRYVNKYSKFQCRKVLYTLAQYQDQRGIETVAISAMPTNNIRTTTLAYDLSSLQCLVTGASSGIGKATCEILTRYGAMVVGAGRSESSLRALKEKGSIVDYVVADITVDGECVRLVTEAVTKLGGSLTTVVNGAGGLRGGPIGMADLENYHYNMRLNCQAPYEIIAAAVPHLKKKHSNRCYPSIVTVSSVNGKQSFASCASYCMSKAAVDQLTRCASIDLANDGIRVNAVNPGVIQTNLHRAAGMSNEEYKAFLKRSIKATHPLAASLGRVGQPKEVAELIAFLVSDKALFLTGECIAIDGARQNLGAR